MKVISNSSPLIALSRIDKLYIIRNLFDSIIIPWAVYMEVIENGKEKEGIEHLIEAVDNWIFIKEVRNKDEVKSLMEVVDYGEAEVLILAKELKADLVLLDNKEPRLLAKEFDLNVIGTVGLILLAYKNNLIKDPVEIINQLREKGFYLDSKILEIFKSKLGGRHYGEH